MLPKDVSLQETSSSPTGSAGNEQCSRAVTDMRYFVLENVLVCVNDNNFYSRSNCTDCPALERRETSGSARESMSRMSILRQISVNGTTKSLSAWQ